VVAGSSPREGSAVDDDSTESVSVSSHPLGKRVDDNVGAVSDGVCQVGGAEGCINDEGDLELVGVLGNGLEVADLKGRVGDRLAVESAGLLSRSEATSVVRISILVQ